MTMTDSSFMQIDNLISSNVKVGRLLANVPAGASGSAIDMTHKNGIGLVLGGANVVISSSETHPGISMTTSEPSLKFELGSIGSYTISSNPTKESFEHTTTLANHEFISGNVGNRMRVGTKANGVSLASLDAGGARCPLVIEGTIVDIPVSKINMSNVIFVDGGNVKLDGRLAVANVLTVDPNASIVSITGDATISNKLTAQQMTATTANIIGSMVAGSSQVASLVVTGDTSAQSATVSQHLNVGKHCSVGYSADQLPAETGALSVRGNVSITDALTVSGNLAASNIQTSSLSVAGPAVVSQNLSVGGNIMTTSIGNSDSNLSLTANVLYFNTNHVMFKGNSYVVNTSSTTYTDKVIRLGDSTNSMYNDTLRNGSGIVLVGAPDNKPANLRGNIHMRWLAAGGVFDAAGKPVPADVRSRWEVAGGNLAIKSIDEQNTYMFSIDSGVLNLYKCALDGNGAQVNSQLVAAFGRNAF